MTRRKKAYVPMGNRRTIYLAGGCFREVEGYANGKNEGKEERGCAEYPVF